MIRSAHFTPSQSGCKLVDEQEKQNEAICADIKLVLLESINSDYKQIYEIELKITNIAM